MTRLLSGNPSAQGMVMLVEIWGLALKLVKRFRQLSMSNLSLALMEPAEEVTRASLELLPNVAVRVYVSPGQTPVAGSASRPVEETSMIAMDGSGMGLPWFAYFARGVSVQSDVR